MIETARAFEWLYGLLSADATLVALINGRVYRHVAPQGAARPFLVAGYLAGSDVMTVSTARIMSSLVCTVRAVGLATQYGTLVSIADRADTLLHAASGVVADARVLSCVRELALDYYEVSSEGLTFAHIGGQYRLQIQA